jgi:hypothetical protein
MASDRLARLITASLLCVSLGCGDNQTAPPSLDVYAPGALEPLACIPNLDGRIDANELIEATGVPVSYVVSPAGSLRPVDTAGSVNSAGQRRWDWSAASAQDQLATIQASQLTGKWYAARFERGQFVAPLDLGGRVEAIYRRDAEGFFLLGLASSEEEPPEGQTIMVYDQPIALYRFPLEVGKQWTSVGNVVNGRFRGLPYAARDTYDIRVEAIGELRLPELIFDQALQVRTRATIAPAVGQSVTTQQISFLFECFGEVARATSANNEQEPFFTQATELRRLGVGYTTNPTN